MDPLNPQGLESRADLNAFTVFPQPPHSHVTLSEADMTLLSMDLNLSPCFHGNRYSDGSSALPELCVLHQKVRKSTFQRRGKNQGKSGAAGKTPS